MVSRIDQLGLTGLRAAPHQPHFEPVPSDTSRQRMASRARNGEEEEQVLVTPESALL
jgi:hypothetical protein